MLAGVGTTDSALGEDGVLDIDTTISLETTWHGMEELVSLGLVRSIGIRYNWCCNLFSLCFSSTSITIHSGIQEMNTYFCHA